MSSGQQYHSLPLLFIMKQARTYEKIWKNYSKILGMITCNSRYGVGSFPHSTPYT